MTEKECLKTALVGMWDSLYQNGLNQGVEQGFKRRHVKSLAIGAACREIEKICREIVEENADKVHADVCSEDSHG